MPCAKGSPRWTQASCGQFDTTTIEIEENQMSNVTQLKWRPENVIEGSRANSADEAVYDAVAAILAWPQHVSEEVRQLAARLYRGAPQKGPISKGMAKHLKAAEMRLIYEAGYNAREAWHANGEVIDWPLRMELAPDLWRYHDRPGSSAAEMAENRLRFSAADAAEMMRRWPTWA
jgi:hypothetical protein